jgi:glycosyltransferase involved in cell wall biosynthesis
MRILHVGDDFAELRPCGLTLYSDALMRAQAERGHDVAYVFSGRVYPRLSQPRLKRWRKDSIAMFELIGSPIHNHWEAGTLHPEQDLEEPAGEIAFRAAARETAPDVVHIHELARLPSSVIELAKGLRLPVVMTLHDYKPLCATVRLFDGAGQRCLKHQVGEDCARNCANAPAGAEHLIDWTMQYERRRLKRAVPLADRVDFSFLAPLISMANRALGSEGDQTDQAPAALEPPAAPSLYQQRRDTNATRLQQCDRLVAPSARVAEIYSQLGVDRERLTVQRLTLPHLEQLRSRRGSEMQDPLVFVTLGACASRSKGSAILSEAIQTLEQAGMGGRYRLLVLGYVEPDAVRALDGVESVELHGPYEPDDLDELLDLADVGIVPSVWEEAHGFVGIELLAKGIPVIGSDLGGIPEYVRPGVTGWLNRSVSGAELAELMTTAIEDRAETQRLRRSVREHRDEIVRPMPEHVAEVLSLYNEIR